jgi:hypothetical protein
LYHELPLHSNTQHARSEKGQRVAIRLIYCYNCSTDKHSGEVVFIGHEPFNQLD